MRAERVGGDTLLAQIVAMVAAAQRSRAPIQKLADAVAGWFVPAVVLVAVVTFVGLGDLRPGAGLGFALVNAVAVLIIACPCALGLATPMSIMVGTGRGATLGVLVAQRRGARTAGKVDTLVVDKTGTLTEGKPRLVAVDGARRRRRDRIAAPRRRPRTRQRAPARRRDRRRGRGARPRARRAGRIPQRTGKGVRGTVDGQRVAIGNAALMADLGIDAGALTQRGRALRRRGAERHVRRGGRQAGRAARASPTRSRERRARRSRRCATRASGWSC